MALWPVHQVRARAGGQLRRLPVGRYLLQVPILYLPCVFAALAALLLSSRLCCLCFSFAASCGLSLGLSGSPCWFCVSWCPFPRLFLFLLGCSRVGLVSRPDPLSCFSNHTLIVPRRLQSYTHLLRVENTLPQRRPSATPHSPRSGTGAHHSHTTYHTLRCPTVHVRS